MVFIQSEYPGIGLRRVNDVGPSWQKQDLPNPIQPKVEMPIPDPMSDRALGREAKPGSIGELVHDGMKLRKV